MTTSGSSRASGPLLVADVSGPVSTPTSLITAASPSTSVATFLCVRARYATGASIALRSATSGAICIAAATTLGITWCTTGAPGIARIAAIAAAVTISVGDRFSFLVPALHSASTTARSAAASTARRFASIATSATSPPLCDFARRKQNADARSTPAINKRKCQSCMGKQSLDVGNAIRTCNALP